MSAPKAVILDFNGTLSDDEPLLLDLLREAFRTEAGLEIDTDFYEAELLGLSDPEIVARVLDRAGQEPEGELRQRILQAKIAAYKEAIRAELRIGPGAIEFARTLAASLPIAIASGAFAEEIELALELVGIRKLFACVVAVDEVDRGKPDPEGYELALARINQARSLSRSIVSGHVMAVEDSAAGVTAAHAAGFRCAAVGTDQRVIDAADLSLGSLDAEAAERVLAG